MQKIDTISHMSGLAAEWKQAGRKVALVPTSGALHAGHAALIALAESRADSVVVVIFPNPLAFGPSENFADYPRSPDADLKLCGELKVDAVFIPAVEEMFPRGFSTFVTEESASKPLCGVSRPAHFRGVATAMAKLMSIVRPEFVVMGRRDPQRVAVVRRMIADLCLGAEVLVAPIVRDRHGLAIAVRNRDLTALQRQEALSIHAALNRGREMAEQGVGSPDRIIAEVTHMLGEWRQVRVIYVAIVDPNTMESQREVIPGRSLLAIAVWVGEVRLIDNVML